MSKEAMKLALEAIEMLVRFESDSWELGSCRIAGRAITTLREALAEQLVQPQQEPVAWISESENLLSWDKFYDHMTPLYTSPPAQRKPLTDDEIQECWYKTQGDAELFARAIEAKLKEKNT